MASVLVRLCRKWLSNMVD